MWEILVNLAKEALSKSVGKVFKVFRNPRAIANYVKPRNIRNKVSPIKRVQRKMSVIQKMGRLGRIAFSPKARAIERLTHKAMILEQLTNTQYERWGDVINFVPQTSTTASEINKTTGFLSGKSKTELKAMEEVLNKDLKEWHLENAEQIANAISKDENFQDIVDTNTYEQFMDHWKSAFYDSDTTAYLTQDEKDLIWSEIEQDKAYSWWQEREGKYFKSRVIKNEYESQK